LKLNEPVKVVLSPEKMAELKQKYPQLDEEALKDVLQSVHVMPVKEETQPQATITRAPSAEEEGMMPQLFRKIQGGEFTMVDYLMWSEMQDRKEERRRREGQGTSVTPEKIAEAVKKGIDDAVGDLLGGQLKPKTEEEIPSWAKNLQNDMQDIKKRQEKDEDEKRIQGAIKDATGPLKTELEKEREERKRLEEKVSEAAKEKPKSAVDEYVETHARLQKAGLIHEGEQIPPGTPGEITLASKTVDKSEKIITKGMDDVKETVAQVIEFQLEREKRAFQQQAPKLPEIKEEERVEVLQKAAGETGGG